MERSGEDKENSHSNDVTGESEDETNEEDSLEFIRRWYIDKLLTKFTKFSFPLNDVLVTVLCSAGFFYFCQEERVKIKIEFPELSSQEISQELEQRWYKADSDIKLKYDKIAENTRSRYERLL